MGLFDSSTRRGFLKSSFLAAAAGGFGLPAEAQERRGRRREGGGRRGWAIACRDANLKEIGAASTWEAVKAIGADGIELNPDIDGNCPYLFGKDKYTLATPEGVKALAEALRANNCRVTALCLHTAFDQRGKAEIDYVVKMTKAAAELRTRAIRLDIVPRKMKDEDEFLKFAVGVGKEIVEATKDSRVRYGVENHGGTTNKPEFLRKLFEGVGSDRFGLTLDTANFYWFGHPLSKLYEIYGEFAARACHTHCKSIHYPEAEREKQRPTGWEYGKYNCPVYEGDIDFKKVAAILREHRYRGDLCIENESLGKYPTEQRKDILKKEVEFLRAL